jgi:phage gpG-like protein
MGYRLEFKIHGIVALQKGFDRLATHLGDDLTRALNTVKLWWYSHQSNVFRTEGEALLGTPWAPLSDDYLEWKEENYGELPILYLTGRLSQAMRGVGDAFVEQEKKRMALGTVGIPYVYAHDQSYKPNNLPQRQFLAVDKDSMKKLDKAMQRLLISIDKQVQADFNKKYNQNVSKKFQKILR